jgi:CBS domain-containing protein
MKVREVMEKDVVSVLLGTTYEEATKKMHKEGTACVPVVDASGKIVGMLSEKDLFRAMFPDYSEYYTEPHAFTEDGSAEDRIDDLRGHLIDEYMSKKVLSVSPETTVMQAGGIMLSHHIHHLPVVENEKLVGIISREDVYGAILKHRLGF